MTVSEHEGDAVLRDCLALFELRSNPGLRGSLLLRPLLPLELPPLNHRMLVSKELDLLVKIISEVFLCLFFPCQEISQLGFIQTNREGSTQCQIQLAFRQRAKRHGANDIKTKFLLNWGNSCGKRDMIKLKPAPYGSWTSPVTTDLIVTETIGLGQVRLDDGDVYWVEQRPGEGGRNVVVHLRADGRIEDTIPAPFNANPLT